MTQAIVGEHTLLGINDHDITHSVCQIHRRQLFVVLRLVIRAYDLNDGGRHSRVGLALTRDRRAEDSDIWSNKRVVGQTDVSICDMLTYTVVVRRGGGSDRCFNIANKDL